MDTNLHTIEIELWDGKTQEFVVKKPNIEQAIEIQKKAELLTQSNVRTDEIDNIIAIDACLPLLSSPDKETAKEIFENFALSAHQILREILRIEVGDDKKVEIDSQDIKNVIFKVTIGNDIFKMSCRRLPPRALHLAFNSDSENRTKLAVEQFALACNDQETKDIYAKLITDYPFVVLKLADTLIDCAAVKIKNEKKNR